MPTLTRVVMAFILAPVAGTVAFLAPMVLRIASELWERPAEAASTLVIGLVVLRIAGIIGLAIAFAGTIVIGLPAYFLMRKKVSSSPSLSALAGGCVALVTTILVVLIDSGTQSSGMAGIASLMAILFGCGLIAGFVFWLCAFWRIPAFVKNARP